MSFVVYNASHRAKKFKAPESILNVFYIFVDSNSRKRPLDEGEAVR